MARRWPQAPPGFHVWVALEGTAPTETVMLAARALAGLARNRNPESLTTEFLKEKRAGRVFVDWMRAVPGATVVVPYSVRPKDTAPVAVPLTWNELPDVVPDQWSLTALGDRLDVALERTPQPVPFEAIISGARGEGVDLETRFDRFGRTVD
jgi:bifunctional non-homologous end joining protein LigD